MKPILSIIVAAALPALFMVTSGPAHAAPCAGFTDVDTTSPFCPNVDWLKNRRVTLGCTSSTAYCPSEFVSRLQMAAFMNRLGTALTPIVLAVSDVPGALDLDQTPVVCQTANQNITDFPRRAFADATISGTAGAGVDMAMRVVWSTNNGVTWQNFSTAQSLTFVAASQWSSASDLGVVNLDVGGTAKFGVQVSRGTAGGTDLSGSLCQLQVSIASRDGTSSPY